MVIEHYYRLSKSLVFTLIGRPYEEITRFAFGPPYAESIAEATDLASKNMLPQAENVLWQHFYSYVEEEIFKNPNDLVYVLGYLFLCLKEARNLTTLATGKQLKMESEKIQSLLLV
jgi:vacuolar-type H+-ATPase subunit C/Vma6